MNEYVRKFYKNSAELSLALFLTAASGLGQIVSAADLQCSPEGLKGLQRNVEIIRKEVPKDDSYAATRGSDKRKEKDLLRMAEYSLTQYLRDCGYKQ